MSPSWRLIQRKNFTNIDQLVDFLELDTDKKKHLLRLPKFPLNLPFRLAEKIEKNTLDDPIFRQFIPLEQELQKEEGFSLDPVKDRSFCKSPKLLHKYKGRALLLLSSACAMHCRYCFRQNFPYETAVKDFANEIQLLAQDPSLEEVILSGGDPLSLSDHSLQELLSSLSLIPHIKRIRFHTRFPIGIPERIDSSFIALLNSFSFQFFFVIHTNHKKELDEEIFASLRKIQKLGIPILNQSVLLKGVNNCPITLQDLFSTLSNQGIIPYYLHQLDKVEGASHFAVSEEEGKKIMKELQKNLSGYSLPKYAKEEPGQFSKTLIPYS